MSPLNGRRHADGLLAADAAAAAGRVGAAWDALRGARVFVTGGTGFFGTWLLATALEANAARDLGLELVVLTRDPHAFRAKAPWIAADGAVTLVRGDVRTLDTDTLAVGTLAALDGQGGRSAGGVTHVMHAATAASAALNAARPSEMFDTIVEGTRRTLDLARAMGARRVLLVSSGAVYGVQPPELSHVDEAYGGAPDPLDAANAYAEGKRASELLGVLAARAAGGPEVTVARCFAFVGPHLPLDAHFAVGNFIRDALAGGPIRLSGDGSPARSYLYAADLAAWLWVLLARGASGRAYNVGAERGLALWDVARLVAEVAGLGADAATRARTPQPGAPAPRYVPSTRRARAELGLDAWTSLEDAIARTLRWQQASVHD